MGKKLVYTAWTSKLGTNLKACHSAILGQNAIKLWHSGRYISMVPKMGQKLVYTAWTSKSATTLRACNSANFGQNAMKLLHSGWHISGLPKMADLQAFKEVPDLLVHGEYTIFLPIFGTPEI